MEELIIRPSFLAERYRDTYEQIKASTAGMSHSQSLQEITPGINCLNWLVGHIIVARCNFLVFLDEPSIWGMDQIRRYIPGSTPVTNEDATPFDQLLDDLDRSQEQLTAALAQATQVDLRTTRQDRSIAEHLAYYAAHEAQHTGQIEMICLLLERGRS